MSALSLAQRCTIGTARRVAQSRSPTRPSFPGWLHLGQRSRAALRISSLEALQAYSLGITTWNAQGAVAAIPFFKRAVDLNPTFAMAYGRMGTAYGSTPETKLAADNMGKAFQLRTRVSERERLYLESHYYHFVTGELEKAAVVYEVWKQVYPRDPLPHDNLEGVYSALGEHERALEEALETLRLDPTRVSAYEDVSRAYFYLGRFDELEQILNKARERGMDSWWLFRWRYELASMKGDEREMQRLAAGAHQPYLEAWVLAASGCTAGYNGQLKKARELELRAVESAKRDESVPSAAAYLSILSLIEAYLGDRHHARVDAEAAVQLTAPVMPGDPVFSPLALALAGEPARAEELATGLNRDFPLGWMAQRLWLPTIHATVALEHNRPDAAVRLLEPMRPYELADMDAVYAIGRAFLSEGRASYAAAEFQKIIDHPGLVQCNPVGALARLGLGRAYALQGSTAKARATYQDFFTLWKDADPDIPILKQAKLEYAKLE
jgi:tetratricopeptide (TPR) repeat protein